MGIYLLSRALRGALIVVAVAVMVFVGMRVSGDPVGLFLVEGATAEDIANVRARLGLDDPIPVQFANYIFRVFRGDFGTSLRWNAPALDVVIERLPATLELALGALLITCLLGVPLGVFMGASRGRMTDRIGGGVAALLQSVPAFWLGLMLILLVAVALRWAPTGGREGLRHLILPAVTLSAYYVAAAAQLMRNSLIEALSQDYVRTAQAKGASRLRILFRHALKNAAIPVVTFMGIQFSTLMGGAIVTETVFAWPGTGFLLVESVLARDYPVVQATLLVISVVVVVMNIVVDLTYGLLNPRVRY